ncbi:MAG: FimV/HubP family polar landmark protein [Gammaproteobacteria bacterium]
MAHRLVVLLLLCIPSTAYTLGLGDLQKRSQLNERFYATVPIINAKAEELDGLTVKLADVERFRRAGLERPAFLSQLRFEVVETRDGPDYLKITSTEPIREPFINFLIEVNWSKGRLFREYAALLDPPAYKGRSSVPSMRRATRGREPPRGAIVRDQGTTPPWRPEQRAARLAAERAGLGAGGSYGPTVSGDTLWEIALSVRTDPSLSVQQIMFALLHANPNAFFLDNNINALKRGAVLQLPARGDSARMSQREAMQLVSKHSALWEQYRQRVAASAQPQPAGEVSSSGAAGAPAVAADPAEDEAQLKLLAAAGGGASPQSLAPGNVDKGLAIAQETVASQKQEIVELNSKLTEADEIIKLLRKQIEIKDADLAALQAKAAGAPLAPETATPSDRATPETAAPPVSAGASPETSVGGAGTTPKVSASATPGATAPAQPPSQETPVAALEPGPAPGAESSALAESSSLPPAIPAVPTEPESEVAAPLPPPAPEAPAPPDGGGLTDELPGGNLGLIGGIAALVVIGVGMALALKKRGTPDDLGRPVAEDFEPVGVRPASPEDSGTFRMRQSPADDQSAASDVIAESNIEDPLSDLDVYLTYERFEEAERLVNQAIAADPNQPAYKLKLLEVYHASGNKAAFAKSAKELRDATGGQGRLWERATAMWQALSPNQPLLADEPAAASVDVEESEFMDIGVAEQPRGGPGDTVAAAITTTAEPRVTGDLGITKWLDAAPTGTGIDGPAGAAASNAEIIDVTSPSAQDTEATEFIDITAPEGGTKSLGDTTVRVAKLAEDSSDEMTRPMSPVVVDITSPGETGPEATHELPGERTLSSWLKEPPEKIVAPKRSPMDDTLANFDTRIATVDGDDGIEFDLSDFSFEKIDEVKPVISGDANLIRDADPSAPPEKDADPLDIMDLSAEFGLSPEDTSDLYKSINQAEAEQSGTEDEADTTADVDVKLNLAKAYIELGDAEGARSILEEVVQHGVEEQRQEATQLLQQLG